VTEKEAQEEILRREFSRQAHNFEAPRSLFRDTSILEWIGGHLPVAPGARILDVAGGTGRLARHLAAGADGATGVVVDLTDEMLSVGLRSALDDGRTDVVFVRGDATALPFPAGEFDLVVCRFALHHMPRPFEAIAEMARVCRRDGMVAVIDMVAGGSRHDELERLRDPSHVRALTEDEIVAAMRAGGRAASVVDAREHTMLVGPWLDQSHTTPAAREAICGAVMEEARGGAATGLRASESEGELRITQSWVLARS
jgi:ubiquinone/menaquinone biosynthesis C-methylase UbiE